MEPIDVARKLLGFDAFRPGQEQAIRAILEGRDVLAVLPTGLGKSAIYQVAAAMMPGPTVVVSPLIALQRDQAARLEAPERGGAAIVNSMVPVTEQRVTFGELEHEALEYIFLAPEQLHRPDVLAHLKNAAPSLFVVDEAHCISEWGHDFRPEYLRLGAVVDALAHPRVLALTATAPPRVRAEIVERLHMRSPCIVAGAMDRPNVWLGVRECRTAAHKLRLLTAEAVAAEKPGIVYAATRRHAVEVAEALEDAGVAATFYHGGMTKADRTAAQSEFMENGADVVAATSAFGMGVDKPDVRFVFHFDVGPSLNAYYQELGRAGRDGKPARALLFYRPEDLALHRFFAGGGRLQAGDVEEVLGVLGEAGELAEDALRERLGLSRPKLEQAIAELEDQGLVARSVTGLLRGSRDGWAEAADAGDAALEHQERHHRELLHELDRMRIYAETLDCRRQYLLEYLGEAAGPCGRCDNCERGLPAAGEGPRFPVGARVAHRKLGKGMVLGYEGGRIRVLFEDAGEKVLDARYALAQGLLAKA